VRSSRFLMSGGLLLALSANAEEVQIGHLETSDDIGINWLFFHCDKSADRLHLTCDIFSTQIMKAKTETQVSGELQQQNSLDALAEFNKNFGSACEQMNANSKRIDQAIASNQDINGKPLNPRMVAAHLSAMKGVADVCKNPTQDAARQFFTAGTRQQLSTCKVHSGYFKSIYSFNSQTNSWISQEGPTGPCGTIQIGTLTQDKNTFWSYVEKTLRTNPNGVLPNGQSCGLYPEHTLNYTWRTTLTAEGCEFIESYPD
jgi:hypothetical protein